jgi:hypothetical protein
MLLFGVTESGQKRDLDRDGRLDSLVVHHHSMRAGKTGILGLPVETRSVGLGLDKPMAGALSGESTVSEQSQGADLNGDEDRDDSMSYVGVRAAFSHER